MASRFTSKVPQCVIDTCYEYKGVIVPFLMPERGMDKVRNMECRPDDLFLVTYPKSGTTWAEHITLSIHYDGDESKMGKEHITDKIPFVELVEDFLNPETSPACVERAIKMDSPRILKSHWHQPFLPKDISTDDPMCKVMYIARNPKDTAVSYYHFCLLVPGLPSYESWDAFFEEFIADRAPQGSWFENVLPWWKIRDHPNVLFLKYEDMKKDLTGVVRQMAKFMGKSLPDDVIEKISSGSTFSAMKKNPKSNPDSRIPPEQRKEGRSFMRKGIVGDWKNYFTDDQNKRFDAIYEKALAGTGLRFDFE